MLVKFFKTKPNGNPLGGLNYLLHDNRNATPEVLSGNVEVTKQLLLQNTFTRAYTSGCLSFAEKSSEVDSKAQYELMESFEKTLLAGLEPEQYDCVWIRHTDKKDGRLELNFHVVNRELTTNRRLQVYFDKYDRTRVDTWKSLQNDIHGFKDPDAPENKRFVSFNNNFGNRREVVNAINEYMQDKYIHNEIKNRNDVIKSLKEIPNITITRETKKAISIKHPSFEKPFRLKGELYEQHFRRPQQVGKEEPKAQKQFEAERERRIRDNSESLEVLNNKIGEKRKAHFSNISSVNPTRDNSDNEQQLLADKQAINQCISRSKELQKSARQNGALPNKTIIKNQRLRKAVDEPRQNQRRNSIGSRAAIIRTNSSARCARETKSRDDIDREKLQRFAEEIIKELLRSSRERKIRHAQVQRFGSDRDVTNRRPKNERMQKLRERKAKRKYGSDFDI
ncbi:relaxase/mobilization nuclease domain-containing protein [Vibrio parahaemolyticus]|uniref:relaxase/mobilization nuclease domain-containing protein n=1 Tax=Vibrio parahaemolyticus TaxID=670 RepID=UPI001D16C8C6|nr:relaxase/mobilization nuclease domain-containing protein [Vibrio parahaemolyticus]MCC3789005.1 relaxase/mobilization nuclease domain-containing protein [Vibrio parahaemolyticus]